MNQVADVQKMSRTGTAFELLTPFLASIIGSWAWFSTDLLSLRRTDAPSTALWLHAATTLPGYTFIPEPVSDSVMEGLGTTNILSGTFVRNAEWDSRETSVERPEQRGEDQLNPLSRRSTLDPGRTSSASGLQSPASARMASDLSTDERTNRLLNSLSTHKELQYSSPLGPQNQKRPSPCLATPPTSAGSEPDGNPCAQTIHSVCLSKYQLWKNRIQRSEVRHQTSDLRLQALLSTLDPRH